MNDPHIPHIVTDRQREVLRHISAYKASHGYSPSVRDLSDIMGGISTNAIHNHLEACAKKGLIAKNPKVARSLSVTESGTAVLGLSCGPTATTR